MSRYNYERFEPYPFFSVTKDNRQHMFYCRFEDGASTAVCELRNQEKYIEQLERIIYDMTSLRDFMLTGHSEYIYNRILAKYEPKPADLIERLWYDFDDESDT